MAFNPYTGQDGPTDQMDPTTNPYAVKRPDPNAIPDPAAPTVQKTSSTAVPRSVDGSGSTATSTPKAPLPTDSSSSTNPYSWQSVTPTPGSIAATGSQNASAPAPAGYTRDPKTGLLTWTGTGTPTNVVTPKSTPAQMLGLPAGTTGAPSYVDMNDATQAAVWKAFQAKGLSPRDQSDFQYWVDKINSTGGMGNAGNASYWTNRMGQADGGVGDYLGRPEAGATSGGAPGTGVGSVPGGTSSVSADDPELHAAILNLLNKGNEPLTGNDPTLRAQFDPIDRQMQVGAQRAQEGAAERSAAQGSSFGGAGGSLDAQGNSIKEDLATSEGGLMSSMVTSELAARRAQVQQALTFAQGEDAQKLQAQLANLNATIAREQMKQQNQQFYDNMANNNGIDQYLFAQQGTPTG